MKQLLTIHVLLELDDTGAEYDDVSEDIQGTLIAALEGESDTVYTTIANPDYDSDARDYEPDEDEIARDNAYYDLDASQEEIEVDVTWRVVDAEVYDATELNYRSKATYLYEAREAVAAQKAHATATATAGCIL